MKLTTQRRMAASILKVGKNRVWFDNEELGGVEEAVTRADIRGLINDKIIQARQKKGTSRGRANFRKGQEKKGRRSGQGTRKGAKGARFPKKRRWISTIRPIRKTLKELRDSKKIDSITYRKLYGLSKGGIFKSQAHLNSYLKDKKLTTEEPKKPEKKIKKLQKPEKKVVPIKKLSKGKAQKKTTKKSKKKTGVVKK